MRIPLLENEKVSWFLGFKVPWFRGFRFLGFKVSKFQGFENPLMFVNRYGFIVISCFLIRIDLISKIIAILLSESSSSPFRKLSNE